MKELNELLETIERLLAPDGCPWDREQTLQSMRSSLVEETYETIEAIDLDDNRLIEEELGDMLFLVFFLARLAEKEGRFSLKDAAKHVRAKLIRRHPHIFGNATVGSSENVLQQWEQIKQGEKQHQPPQSALDGIPKDLPTLARAEKVLKKFEKKGFVPQKLMEGSKEERAGESLWSSIQILAQRGIEAEQALRLRLTQLEKEFREYEQSI